MSRNTLAIKSRINDYTVDFGGSITGEIQALMDTNRVHFLIDAKVYELYREKLQSLEHAPSVIKIEAIEENKDIKTVQDIALTLLKNGITKNDLLIVIGGGITQDLGAFTAHILMRGIRWYFIPTTLLAMCDSCIGSKCGINMAGFKNQLGVFCPPYKALIDLEFLTTLDKTDILSGIGEILKVHLISGKADFLKLEGDYGRLLSDFSILEKYIFRSLEIKKGIIEIDEFDTDYRHILNYGHTFGHAMEAYTDNFIPHGIGVTLGMEIANFISAKRGFLPEEDFTHISGLLRKNIPYDNIDFSNHERISATLMRDKKYDGQKLTVILCKGIGSIFQEKTVVDDSLLALIESYTKYYRENRLLSKRDE